MEKIRVIELFAGVGGFRLGLEKLNKFEFVWSNQWEPGVKQQHASKIYTERFGEENHSNKDIADVIKNEFHEIREHEMLVAGFPCQDYSVAKTLNQATGIVGKKGVLWWEIYKIIEKMKTKYLLLENVDRLLKSPAKQRGRDFAIMLGSLANLGYIVEWRIINAADYGMPQRRRRVYFFAYHKNSTIWKIISEMDDPSKWILKTGVMARSLKIISPKPLNEPTIRLPEDLVTITNEFNKENKKSPFHNTGIMIGRDVWTTNTIPNYNGRQKTLGEILIKSEKRIPEEYFIDSDPKIIEKWKYLKGAKNEKRTHKGTGTPYKYNEGSMVFPDNLEAPSRTIVTGEGGSGPSRFKHVVRHNGRLRRLTPMELEKLNMFPVGHTEGVPNVIRAFLMGNALVVGVVTKLGKGFVHFIENNNKKR